MTSASRTRLLRRARGTLALAALGAAAVPLIGWSHAVDVVVDGEVRSMRTYASTVGDVLAQLEVPVGAADEVSPAVEEELGDVETIVVARAISVDIAVDGAVVRRVNAPVSTVAGAVAAADLDVDGLGVDPGGAVPVSDGDTVHLGLPRTIQVTVDGATRELTTRAADIGGALTQAGIELGRDDVVDWDLDAAVQPHAKVVIERVAFDEVVEEVTLEHDEVRRDDDDLLEGTTRVAEEGRDGTREDTYRVERVDGEEVDRELIGSEVVREPVDRVVLVGTKAPPPPPPPPAPTSSPRSSGTSGDVWDRLARCEAGGNWAHRGGRFHGGLQFHPQTWAAHKPSGFPQYAYQATREQQIQVGERVRRSQGWAAWPHCSRQLGLR